MSEPNSPLTAREKIEILLEEYKTLRAEIVQQGSSSNQLYGVGGSALIGIWVIAAAYSAKAAVVLLILFPLVMWWVFTNFEFSVRELGIRIRELESEINELAGTKLLRWETEYGGAWAKSRHRRLLYMYGPKVVSLWRQVRLNRKVHNDVPPV